MIKIVWKCINIIAISPKSGMEQAEIMDTFWTYQRGGGETEMRSWKRAPVSRVSRRALNISQRVASEGSWGAQAPSRRGQGGGRATRAPRPLVAPLRLCFGVLEGSETLIFYIFFSEFF